MVYSRLVHRARALSGEPCESANTVALQLVFLAPEMLRFRGLDRHCGEHGYYDVRSKSITPVSNPQHIGRDTFKSKARNLILFFVVKPRSDDSCAVDINAALYPVVHRSVRMGTR